PGRHQGLDGQARRQAGGRHRAGQELLRAVAGRLPAAPGPAAGRGRVLGLVLLPLSAGPMHDGWPWLALAGLGAFHGANPAMGWLFAVALGLHRGSRAVVLESLVPIAVGHALAVAGVALAVVALGLVIDPQVIRIGAAVFLAGWAAYHVLYASRH